MYVHIIHICMYISKYPEPDEDPKSMEISHSNKNDVCTVWICVYG